MRTVKSATAVMVLALGLSFGAHAETTQQTKMKTCNTQAGDQKLAGDDRKSFMKTCLSAAGSSAPTAKALTPQQQKMKTCNADAKTKALTGADRKAFMKTCLSG